MSIDFPMKIEIFRFDAGIVIPLSISYDKYRRPRRGAPAADRWLKTQKNSLPAVPRRGPEAGNSRNQLIFMILEWTRLVYVDFSWKSDYSDIRWGTLVTNRFSWFWSEPDWFMSISLEPENFYFIDSVIHGMTFLKLWKNPSIFFFPAAGIPTIPELLQLPPQ